MKRVMRTMTMMVGSLAVTACLPGLPNLTSIMPGSASAGASSPSPSPSASPSASPSPVASPSVAASPSAPQPDPANVATFSGLKASTCAEEGTLRSSTGPATRVQFTNNAAGRITIYWLNAQGRRVEYRKLAAGQSYEQSTFVTHPWLIANEQDQCLGIYTPVQAGTASLTINQTVTTGAAAPTGPLAPVSEATITEARAREGVACLKAKGDSSTATAIEALINLYVQMRSVVGEDIAKRGYLAPAAKTLADKGC